MKTTIQKPAVFISGLLAAGCCAWAQLAVEWHTLDGGGGNSTGGVYSVSGTIGQPDANTVQMTGGSYTLDGGFWSIYAVQTYGAPFLTITPAGPGQALIAWAPDSGGWVLQQAESLTNGWADAPSATTNGVIVPTTPQARFYRLFKP